MKKFKNSILATLLIILTALCLVLSVALYRQTAQSKSEPVESPRGNTIKVPEEEVGRVTIYRDGIAGMRRRETGDCGWLFGVCACRPCSPLARSCVVGESDCFGNSW